MNSNKDYIPFDYQLAPTLPHFLNYGPDHTKILPNITNDLFREVLFLLKLSNFYVTEGNYGWTFLLQSFPEDQHIIIEIKIYGSSDSTFIIDFCNLKGRSYLYRIELEKIWKHLKIFKIIDKEFKKIDNISLMIERQSGKIVQMNFGICLFQKT